MVRKRSISGGWMRALSQMNVLQGVGCGRFGGGLFIHGATRSHCIRAVALWVPARGMRDFCYLLDLLLLRNLFFKGDSFSAQGWARTKLERVPQTSFYLQGTNTGIITTTSKHISHCLLFGLLVSTSLFVYCLELFLYPLFHLQTCTWPTYVLIQNPHVQYTAEESSLTNRRNWAALESVQSAVQMDGRRDRRRRRAQSVFPCAEGPSCKWARRSKK